MTKNPRILTRDITIAQTDSGIWVNRHTGLRYKSAVNAYRALRRSDREIIESGVHKTVVTTITWLPRTEAGRLAVEVLKQEGLE